MPELSLPMVQALSFTLGCAAIHGLRGHAERVSEVLAVVMAALCLMLFVAVAAGEAPSVALDPDTALQLIP